MLADTHCHLADGKFAEDREAALERARAAGVGIVVEIAESPETWEAAVALAERDPAVYASLGIHPHHAHHAGPDAWPALRARLERLCAHPKVVAIGEFGLDYFRMQNTRGEQDYLFKQQLELAKRLAKPIVIHCREDSSLSSPAAGAHADIQAALAAFYPETSHAIACPAPAGVIHCFSGTWQDAQTYFLHGFLLGVDAPVTYPGSKGLKDNVARMPLERLVLETDSPYLPPQTCRGRRNEPAYLVQTAEAVAVLKHTTPENVASQTTANAAALFRLKSGG